MLWAGCVASAAMDEVSNAACIVRAQDETGRQTHTDTATWRRAIDVTVQVETGETLGMQKVYVSQRKGDTPGFIIKCASVFIFNLASKNETAKTVVGKCQLF